MKKLCLIVGLMFFAALSQFALAQEEERGVAGFVGASVKVFDENLRPSGQFPAADLAAVKVAKRKGSTPFYGIQFAGNTYFVLGSKITFADRPRTDMVPCNTRKGNFEPATYNSTMGSAEQKTCSEVQ